MHRRASVTVAALFRLAVVLIVTPGLPPPDLRADDTSSQSLDGARSSKESNGVSSDAKVRVVRGHVVDAAGMPVGGARLWLPLRYEPRRVAEATSDKDGRFELKFPTDWVSPRWVGSSWTIWAFAPGHGIATQSPYEVVRGNSEEEVELKLAPHSNTRFRILTPAGEPLAGAVVQPLNYKTTVGYDLVPEEMLSYMSARTDADGIATLSAMRLKPLFRVQIVSDPFGKQAIRVDRDLEQPVRDIRLREVARIEGRLVGERKEWLRGVRLAFTVGNQDEWTQTEGEARAVTDENGHFEIPVIASGGPLRTYVMLDPSLPVRPRLNDNFFLAAGETMKLEIPLVSAPKVRAASC